MFFLFDKEGCLKWISTNEIKSKEGVTLEKKFTPEEVKKLKKWATFIDWKIIEDTIAFKEYLKQEDIKLYKTLEAKAITQRSEYLTAEMMPEGILKDKKIAKLISDWEVSTQEFNECVTGLMEKYWESILDELI